MRFGVKKKDAPAASSGGSGGSFIKYFRKGETTVRFLEPATDEWTKYFEHYSASKQRTYPCTGERDTCPGCTSDDKREQQASCRFLVNLLDTETGVQYLFVQNGYGGGLTVLVDRDGKPMTWQV